VLLFHTIFIAPLTTKFTHSILSVVPIRTPLFASIRAELSCAFAFRANALFHPAHDHMTKLLFHASLLCHHSATPYPEAELFCHHITTQEDHAEFH
jgi:hypothetical protein